MPFNNYNPVLEGITTAMDIAGRIRNAALQQEQLQQMKQRDLNAQEERQFQREQHLYERKRQQEQDALSGVETQMKMLGAGIHAATPQDITESSAPRFVMDESGNQTPLGQVGTSIRNRMFNYGGQKMVMPSPEEDLAETMRRAKLLGDAETMAKINQVKQLQEATGVSLDPDTAAKLGLPPGTKIPQQAIDNYIGIAGRMLAPEQDVNWQTQMTDQGLVQVNPRTGEVRQPVMQGKKLTRTPRTGGGMGGPVLNVPMSEVPANWQPGQLNTAALGKYPVSAQRLAKQLVDYQVPMPTGMAAGREPWASAIQAAGELDPTWRASEYSSRLSARRSFTSGADAKNINGINTAIGHLETLAKAGEKLDNWRVTPVNRLRNYARSRTGDPSVVRFDIAANAVVNELASVFKGTGATDQEIQAWRRSISPDQSPDQIKQAVGQAVELLGSRMDALKNKWEQSMGKPLQMQILSPKSRKVLASMGYDPGDMEAPTSAASPAAGAAAAIPGEQTAVNPTTGQRIVLRGGQWVPLQ